MKTLLTLLCALALLSAAVPAELQCAYNQREYLCLVPKKCIDARATQKSLVILEPDMQLINGKCEAIVRFKFIDDFLWIIRIDFEPNPNIRHSIFLETDAPNRLFSCYKAAGNSDIVRRTRIDKPKVFEGYENCEFEIMSKFPSSAGDPFQEIASLFTGSTKLFLKLETLENKEKRRYSFEGSLDKLALAIGVTSGCDENLITMGKQEAVSEGAIMQVSKRLIGNNAEINCNEKNADLLHIIRENKTEWEQVHSVFCHGDVWAYRKENKKSQPVFMGKEKFEMKCIRNWCKYCGELDEFPCEAGNCELVLNYDNCVPTCPRDLWFFGNHVHRTSMKCEKLTDGKGEYGAWMAKVNGVDTPVASASCYVGPFPLLEATTANSAPSASLWSIIAVTSVLLV